MSTKEIEIEDIDQSEEIKKPSRYMVILFNDNFTSFEFVMAILINIFHKTIDQSHEITLSVHENGEGVAGNNYSLEVAKSKVDKVLNLAKANGFPLKCEYREQK